MNTRLERPDLSQFNLNMSSMNPYYNEGAQDDVTNDQSHGMNDDEFINEPPLLEDLGIDIQSVKSKLVSVILFMKPNPEFVQKPDMTGPMFIGTILGILLAMVL